jgi:hypothetical protein
MLDGTKVAESLRITATVHVGAIGKQVKRQKMGIAKR